MSILQALPVLNVEGFHNKNENTLPEIKNRTVAYFRELLNRDIYFTTSCTTALELAALTIGIKEGDEVIIPSFTFVGTANAFAKLGAKIVFVDIDPLTMCMDSALLERCISDKTKAIVPVHYAGNACNMTAIIKIARKHGIYIIEDAAQCIFSYHEGNHLGTIGDIGCISFDYQKNIQCEQGGVLIVNNPDLLDKADMAYHNGTNRTAFQQGIAPYYEWCSLGSNFTMPSVNFGLLYNQLIESDSMQKKRKAEWSFYYKQLKSLEEKMLIELPFITEGNAHIFYIKTEKRNQLIAYFKSLGLEATPHFTPLHSSKLGSQYQYYSDNDYTTSESDKLLRLPLSQNLTKDVQDKVINALFEFFGKN
ncbi:MAG: rffA [Bacteroidota bacterium]|nr:rffA [Bacteroidota bacterium]